MKIAAFNKKNVVCGIVSGVIAGFVTGLMTQKMGIFSNLGMMMGAPGPVSGFFLQLILCGVIGLIFALVFYKWTKRFFPSVIWGIVYGIIGWFLGTLTLCRMLIGVPVSWSSSTMMEHTPLLMSQLVFGLVLGVSYFWLRHRK